MSKLSGGSLGAVKTRRRSAQDRAILWEIAWRQVAPQVAPELHKVVSWLPEYEFAGDIGRKYVFDYALPNRRIAVEVDGGNRKAAVKWRKDGKPYAVAIGAHTQDADYWKRAAACSMGWIVFAFTPTMLTDDPWQCVTLVCDSLYFRA